MRPYLGALVLGLVFLLGSALSSLGAIPIARQSAFVFAQLAKRSPGALRELDLLALAGVALYFAKGLCSYLQNLIMAHVGLRVVRDIRSAVFAALQRQGLSFFTRFRQGDLASRAVTEVPALRDAIVLGYSDLLPNVLVLVGALAYIVWVNWHLALLTMLGLPLVGTVLTQFSTRLRRWSLAIQRQAADILTTMTENLATLQVVKGFGREDFEQARFDQANDRHFLAAFRGAQVQALQTPLVAFLQTSAIAGVLWVGGWEIFHGRLAVADLLAFGAAVGVSIDPVLAVSSAWGRIQQASGALARVFEILDAPPEGQDAPDAMVPDHCSGGIAMRGVRFAYPRGPEVLAGVDLAIHAGQITALVGPSGGGKSTLIGLLLRFYDPTSGEITLDGVALGQLKAAWLRQQVGFVPQDPVLFYGTIADNVAFGKLGASRQEIEEACRAASAHEFIAGLENGYETLVGERGAALSGGQRQRLAIARALIRDPRVLLLDEITSALDPESEAAIRDSLLALRQDRAIVAVSHRPAIVEVADQVIEITNGVVTRVELRQPVAVAP